MRISFDYTKRDYLQFPRYHYLHTSSGLLNFGIMLTVPMILSYSALHSNQSFWEMVLPFCIVTFFYLEIFIFRGLRQATKMGFFGSSYVQFTEEGLETLSPSSGSTFSWDLIHRIVDRPQVYLIYVQKTCAVIVPKRAFSSEVDHQKWREQIVLLSKKEIQ